VIGFLSAGTALGLYAGFSPGPLIALVISQAIKHGPKGGVKVAIAPLLSNSLVPILSVGYRHVNLNCYTERLEWLAYLQ